MEDIKEAVFEEMKEIPNDKNWIERQLIKLQEKLIAMRKADKEKEFLASPEGKRWQAKMKELEEAREKDMKHQAEAYAEILKQAKRQLVLDIEADRLIEKLKIADNDPRLSPILYKLEEMSRVISEAYMQKGRLF